MFFGIKVCKLSESDADTMICRIKGNVNSYDRIVKNLVQFDRKLFFTDIWWDVDNFHTNPSGGLRCSVNERNLTVNGRMGIVFLCNPDRRFTAVFWPYFYCIDTVYQSFTVRISIKIRL